MLTKDKNSTFIDLSSFVKDAEDNLKKMRPMMNDLGSKVSDLMKNSEFINPPVYYKPLRIVPENPELLEKQPLSSNLQRINIYVTEDGSFVFEGKRLKNISTDSIHGKLLKMLIESNDYFVSVNSIVKSLVIEEPVISTHINTIKKMFRINNLLIDFEKRKDSKGYVLISIKRLSKKAK